MLKSNFKDFIERFQKKSKQEQEDLDGMISALADEIMTDLDKGKDQVKSVNWTEFKNFLEKSMKSQQKLKNFLLKY